jgi:quinolinate synthase
MKISYDPDQVRAQLAATMLPHEIDDAMDRIAAIQRLKREKQAVILGHNYMTPDVYWGVSDFVGDSLGLSRLAAQADAELILFNGVHFMAETAKILNPSKTVLIAAPDAGCSLAESITAEDVRELKKYYPGAPVVTYVNCSAAVKAETDICCTSANAVKVVASLEADTVIFLPDAFLAKNVAKALPHKNIISWERGKCMVHEQYRAEDVQAVRRQWADLLVLAHPECDTSVTSLADFSGSTSQFEGAIKANPAKNILLITECSMGDNLRAVFPERRFISTCHTCPHMKKITLDAILHSLQTMTVEVDVPTEIAEPARLAVERMLAIA